MEDTEGINRIRFGPGITLADISFTIESLEGQLDSLKLQYGDGDSVLIVHGLEGAAISSYEFADGTVLSHAEFTGLGFGENDIKIGTPGNVDTLRFDSAGTVQTVFQDVRLLGSTTAPTSVEITSNPFLGLFRDVPDPNSAQDSGNALNPTPNTDQTSTQYDLQIDVGDTGNCITITNWFSPDDSAKIERFEFTDGTVWSDQQPMHFLPVAAILAINICRKLYNGLSTFAPALVVHGMIRITA